MKKLFLGAMAFLVAVTLVACGSKKDADESIKENKKLVVAVSPLISQILTMKHKMLSSFVKVKSLLTQVLMLSKVRK